MLSSWVPVLGLLSGLTVETGSPDALCPDVASAEAAIAARVGELEDPSRPYRVHYTLVHAPDSTAGDYVRLKIFDGANALRLSRDLPLTAETCDTMAQAMALVVGRFFRAMVGERVAEPVPASAPASASASAPRAPAPAPAPASAPLPRSTPTPMRDAGAHAPPTSGSTRTPAFLLAAQAGVLGPLLRPTFGSLFVIRVRSALSLATSVGVVLVPWTETLERSGEAHLQSGIVRLSPAWDFALVGARVALGPTLSLDAERAWTTGPLVSTTQYRATSAAGAALSFRIAVGRASALDISALVEAPFRPFGGEFTVDGEEVLEPPPLRGALAVGWGPAWFR